MQDRSVAFIGFRYLIGAVALFSLNTLISIGKLFGAGVQVRGKPRINKGKLYQVRESRACFLSFRCNSLIVLGKYPKWGVCPGKILKPIDSKGMNTGPYRTLEHSDFIGEIG